MNAVVCVVAVLASACTTLPPRAPVPQDEIELAAPYGIRGPDGGLIRAWGDTVGQATTARLIAQYATRMRDAAGDRTGPSSREVDMLALSGGGPDGSFAAGLLNGWTERGDRPQFNVVTGVSTGAIIALFALLGPDFDDQLAEVYTSYETDDLLEPTIFSGITGGSAMTNTAGYRALIEDYVDDEVMARLSAAYADGRTLLVGTTNLDFSRPVVWNLTAIAASGHPDARRLVQDVVQASSAIPVAFPPVVIPVETPDGRRFDEMHVDGGAANQVFLFSPEVPLARFDALMGGTVERRLFVVINNQLRKSYEPVRPRIVPIAAASVSSLIGGAGTSDIYKIFAIAERDNIELNIISIPSSFTQEPEEPFDSDYMRKLFDVGFEHGLASDRWSPYPPDFDPG